MYPAHIRNDGTIQTCSEHCIHTAELSGKCLQNIGLGHTGYLGGLLHDCGKFTTEFTEYIQKAASGEAVKKGSVIHSFAAINYFLQNYHSGENVLRKLTSEMLAISCGCHHGLFDCFDKNSESGFDHRIKKQQEYDAVAINNFLAECADKSKLDYLFDKSVCEIENQIKSARNLCKKSERKSNDLWFFFSLVTRMLTSAIVNADRSDTADFMENNHIREKADITVIWEECLNNLNSYLNTFPQLTEIQTARRELSDLCNEAAVKPSGIYKLNLPTGAGKTLSSLRFALNHAAKYKKERVFYISPLLSILDQNAVVIRKALGHDDLILEHHSDIVNEGMSCEEWPEYEHLTDTWDSPIIITTLVQFLNTLFSGKMSSVRRFYSLANSVVIIDEVQTVPTKMLTLFNLAIDYLSKVCGTTFVMCSATQPELSVIPHPLEAEELVPTEKINKYETVFKRNVILDKGTCILNEIPKRISELMNSYQSVLVVCNKKSESASLFSSLQFDDVNCFHLSAGMCMAHRKETLRKIKTSLESRRKTVCIATQVIEAGVDISFDAVIRLSAGMDSVIQSAGRCNRNGTSKIPSPVWIINCEDERLSQLKEIQEAKFATEALLDAYTRNSEAFRNDLSSDQAIEFYYKKLYAEKNDGYFDFSTDGYSIYSMLSDNYKWRDMTTNTYIMNQAFRSAGEAFNVFDNDQKSIIVPWKTGQKIINEIISGKGKNLKEILNKAKPYAVSVYEFQYRQLEKCGALQLYDDGLIAVLSEEYYDNNTGIKEVTEKCSIQIW